MTVYTGKVEIGQNIRTSLAQTVADELAAPMSAIALVMADTDLTPYDAGTFGSRTTPTMAPQLAKAAATAREMLIDLAAATWQVPRQSLVARDGAIRDPSGRTLTFGALTHGQNLTGVVSGQAPEEPRDHWTSRGTALHKVNAREIVTGRHVFPADVVRPNLLIGRVVRPPAYGATPKTVDDAKARAMPGVTVVRDGNFIVAWSPQMNGVAKAAAAAVSVDWDLPTGLPTSETVFDHLQQTAESGRSSAPSGAPPGAARTFEAVYRIPYIAHVPRSGPRAATRRVGRATRSRSGPARSGRSASGRMSRGRRFRLPEVQVRVIVPDMGSGYGGKHTVDAATEAARLAKAVGQPVKIVYTRG